MNYEDVIRLQAYVDNLRKLAGIKLPGYRMPAVDKIRLINEAERTEQFLNKQTIESPTIFKKIGRMKAHEKINDLKDNNMSAWMKTRREVEDEYSQRQTLFCICGKLATGLHERSCRKFNQRIDTETASRLKHLIGVKNKTVLLTDEQYHGQANQNRDNTIVGYREV